MKKQIAIAMVAILLLSVSMVPIVMSDDENATLGDENVTNITNVNETYDNETMIEETADKEPTLGSGNENISQYPSDDQERAQVEPMTIISAIFDDIAGTATVDNGRIIFDIAPGGGVYEMQDKVSGQVDAYDTGLSIGNSTFLYQANVVTPTEVVTTQYFEVNGLDLIRTYTIRQDYTYVSVEDVISNPTSVAQSMSLSYWIDTGMNSNNEWLLPDYSPNYEQIPDGTIVTPISSPGMTARNRNYPGADMGDSHDFVKWQTQPSTLTFTYADNVEFNYPISLPAGGSTTILFEKLGTTTSDIDAEREASILPPPTPATDYDVFFLVDGSGSISASNFQLQKEGLAYALNDPSITSQDGSVSVCVIQFSDYAYVEVPLTTITSQSVADSISARIMAMSQLGGSTNMADAFDVAVANFPSVPAKNQIIDLSTDGAPTAGGYGTISDRDAAIIARDAAVAAGFEVWVIGVDLTPGSTDEEFLQGLVYPQPYTDKPGLYMYATDFQHFKEEIGRKIRIIRERCEPCVSIEVDVSINNNNGAIPYWPWNVFRYNVSVTNNQTYKSGKSRIAITYGLIDPTPKTITIGTHMSDIYLNDTYNFSGDFMVPEDVYSGSYVFFASAFDMETGCCGCNAVPFSVEMPSWSPISTTSKEESSEPWLEIVED